MADSYVVLYDRQTSNTLCMLSNEDEEPQYVMNLIHFYTFYAEEEDC